MRRTQTRLERLESSRGAFGEIIALIRQGAYYDALTDEQRQQYAEYHGITVAALEGVEIAVNGDLHFPLMANQHFKTEAERTAHIQIVTAEVEQLCSTAPTLGVE